MTAEKYGCDYLNAVVKKMTMDAYSKNDKSIPSIEFTAAKAIDYQVYEKRDDRVTYALWVITAFLLYTTVPKMSHVEIGLATLICWCYSDIYGGLVHIVLDHKDIIYYKVLDLWRPALEFQWHHWIPHDIVDKPVMCVLGDINRAVPLNVVSILVSGYVYGFDDPVFHYCFACKLLMAYVGQLSHRMTHCTSKERPALAHILELLLIPKVEHQKHHKDHSMNFAILCGWFNPCLNSLVTLIGEKTVWPYLFLLALFSAFDVHVIAHKLVPEIVSCLQ